MNRKQPITKICQLCGREFEDYSPRAKYCPECRTTAYRKKHKEYLTGYTPAPKEPEAPKRTLDDKLEELRANGQSYADAQRAETIEVFARVTPSEPSEPREAIEPQEKPAAPAERSRKMYLSAKEREALVKVQVEAEILMEYFKAPESDVMEFPGIILGKIAEQVGELLKEEEA